MSSQTENANLWLQNLFLATLEASAVPELVINSRVGRDAGRRVVDERLMGVAWPDSPC